MSQIDELRQEIAEHLSTASSVKEVEAVQVHYLGRKGPIQQLMRDLRDCPKEQRPEMGRRINLLKEWAEQQLSEARASYGAQEESLRLERETVDVTLPGQRSHIGRPHPITQVMDELLDIFMDMGFSVQYGPEVESDYYNFEALNFGKDHPARDEHDTFYIRPDILLRTHTSPTQVRVMEHHKPPIRVVAPGRCFRNEDITARAHVMFHQIEGFSIDKTVSFADLIDTIQQFLTRLFGQDRKMRFRASYFPFVEPGMEVDIECLLCQGKGCPVCKKTGWVEILGAGMIHPEVLRSGGIDPEEFSGYAWGMGIERLVLLRYRVHDIRLLTDNDLRFLQQFPA